MSVYLGNQLETLFDKLKIALFSTGGAFTKRLVLVENAAMKNWLMMQFASDRDFGCAFGLQLTFLETFQKELIAKNGLKLKRLPGLISKMDLSLMIFSQIQEIMASADTLDDASYQLWQPLFDYFFATKPCQKNLNKQQKEKLLMLSSRLALLFHDYNKYGTKMLKEWKKQKKAFNWQQALWKLTVNEIFPTDYPFELSPSSLHVFGFSHLTKVDHSLFSNFANKDVFYYLLSPCSLFWTDILSDQECRKAIRYWQKQNIHDHQETALKEYLYDRNPLLANMGKMGRELVTLVENSHRNTEAHYELDEKLRDHPTFADHIHHEIHFIKQKEKLTLLDYLKADILLMRNVKESNKISLDRDCSIQIFQATTPLREVETLIDTLFALIQQRKNDKVPLFPEDILVLAPSVAKYAPYIKTCFCEYQDLIDYEILDLDLLSKETLGAGFLHLLSLASSRFSASSLLQLFSLPEFQRKHNLLPDDICQIEKWMRVAKISWGEDPMHRAEVLKREFGSLAAVDDHPKGTWKWGGDRLLFGLAMILPKNLKNLPRVIPINQIDSSHLPLFEKWITLLRAVREDLEPLARDASFPLRTWSIYLKSLLFGYFDTENTETAKVLLDFFESLTKSDLTVPFSTVHYHLKKFLMSKKSSSKESSLQVIRFASIYNMHKIPAKVIALLGMSDEYPRHQEKDSLHLLRNHSKGCDYFPTEQEQDRYYFLETLFAAKEHLILSYCNRSLDGSELGPSLLITELLDALDAGYVIDSQSPKNALVKQAPSFAYDKSLFTLNSDFQSFSKMYFKAASANEGKKQLPHCFFPDFTIEELTHLPAGEWVELFKIEQLAKNPLATYMSLQHNMYLRELKGEEEEFSLNALTSAILRKKALIEPFEWIIQFADKQGRLPTGPFREYYIEKLESEANKIKEEMKNLEIDSRAFFDIEMSPTAIFQERKKNEWVLPPLKCQSCSIIGHLSDVTEAGLVTFLSCNKNEVLKIWPKYLVFLALRQKYQLPVGDGLIFAKDAMTKRPFFEDPLPLLEAYLRYYFLACQSISPLIPEWVPELIFGDKNTFENKVNQICSEKNPYVYNPYLKWAVRGSKLPDKDSIVKNWKSTAQNLFEDLYIHWFPNVLKKGTK